MKYFYDFEFIEDGVTIDPISIGIVRDDGREYYAVFKDAPWYAVRDHSWLMANVVPHLPPLTPRAKAMRWLFNMDDPCVKNGNVIAAEVRDFLIGDNEPVELWGYYSAYDHVALAQLWGPMMNRPKGIPMWTNDVQQLAYAMDMEGILPEQPKDAHNALSDARWTKEAYEVLKAIDSSGVCVTTRPDSETAAQAVFQALGEASMCWENPTGAGVFQDAQASAIARRLLIQLGYQVPPSAGAR